MQRILMCLYIWLARDFCTDVSIPDSALPGEIGRPTTMQPRAGSVVAALVLLLCACVADACLSANSSIATATCNFHGTCVGDSCECDSRFAAPACDVNLDEFVRTPGYLAWRIYCSVKRDRDWHLTVAFPVTACAWDYWAHHRAPHLARLARETHESCVSSQPLEHALTGSVSAQHVLQMPPVPDRRHADGVPAADAAVGGCASSAVTVSSLIMRS